MADPKTLTVENGVVFRLKQPSLLAVNHRGDELDRERPAPPIAYIEDKGREEPNDADPAYQLERMAWETKRLSSTYDILWITGTELESCPTELPGPESEGFAGLMRAMGMTLGPSIPERYIQWIRYSAVTATEWRNIMHELMDLIGVREETVAEMARLFQGDEAGQAPEPDHVEERSTNGHRSRTNSS